MTKPFAILIQKIAITEYYTLQKLETLPAATTHNWILTTGTKYFVFCRLYPFLPPATPAVSGSYLLSLYCTLN